MVEKYLNDAVLFVNKIHMKSTHCAQANLGGYDVVKKYQAHF